MLHDCCFVAQRHHSLIISLGLGECRNRRNRPIHTIHDYCRHALAMHAVCYLDTTYNDKSFHSFGMLKVTQTPAMIPPSVYVHVCTVCSVAGGYVLPHRVHLQADILVDYLRDYARAQDAQGKIWYNTTVVSVDREGAIGNRLVTDWWCTRSFLGNRLI